MILLTRIDSPLTMDCLQFGTHPPSLSMYIPLQDQLFRHVSIAPSANIPYFPIREMNGCFNASWGVHRFSGLSMRQRSSKSAKRASSLVSASVKPLLADIRRVRRSRDWYVNASVLIISYTNESSVKRSLARWSGNLGQSE